ncbi:MAG: DNA replication/repair protein RecF [Bacillota bacterium]|nr:DNA replication/repair protein RecF [Bacillota bacterium]
MLVQLHLKNFRNYRDLDFSPPEGFTVLVGPNGIGKSNLLEGIFYLGAGYSYRQHQDDVLVGWGSDFFVIRGKIQSGGLTHNLEVAYQRGERRKITRINGKRDSSGSCAAYLPVVVFSPTDLLLLQGAPGLRRRFLDLVTSQIRPQHAVDLHSYQEILVQRNNLLKQGAFKEVELRPWDVQLVEVGARILRRRLAVFMRLIELSREVLTSLGCSGDLEGAYISHVVPPSLQVREETEYRNLFSEALARLQPLEERWRATPAGPHRDDLRFYLRDYEVRFYCSQGEQRLLALALKIGQCRLLGEEQKVEPLLLLDDVFSELDPAHQKQVFEELQFKKQVIAATTSCFKTGLKQKQQLTPEIFFFTC